MSVNDTENKPASNDQRFSKALDGAAAPFVALVGERVKQARKEKGVSRRVLSEASDISQRYLAQLENGSGNISIALLYRVAKALDQRIEWLVSLQDIKESAQVAELYRSASIEQRRDVMRVLDPEGASKLKLGRICLVGLRGAGKSTLGNWLGSELGLPFIELNSEIEAQCGMAVGELIALYGQEGYRRLEKQALEQLISRSEPMVLAVAGGIVSNSQTYSHLLEHFHTIWLKALPDEHMRRVRCQGDERPMAGSPKAMDELKSILTSREKLYASADAMVDTGGKQLAVSKQELLQTVRSMRIV